MTLFFYYGSGDFGNQRVRLGDGFSFTEAAESGTIAMSRVKVDDPAADLTIVGHHSFRASETACSWDTLYRGYFADRTLRRDRDHSMLVAGARVWDGTVYDLNGALQFEVIRGTGGKRPAETDTARLAWLLGSGYMGPISSSGANVFGEGENLDKADYRGQTAADVLADCAQTTLCNYFVAWSDSAGSAVLHYYKPTRAYNTSSMRISNVLSDLDSSTLPPSMDAELQLNPDRVYSGVYYKYGEHAAAEFRTSAPVLAAIGHKRETTEEDSSVRTSAKAIRKADQYLAEAVADEATISVTLTKVPPAKVNLIRAGQRMEVRFTHLPGYESFTYVRILRRTVEQDGDTQLFYRITLDLSDPKQAGSRVRHKPQPVPPGLVDSGAVSLTRYSLEQTIGTDDGHGGTADGITYGVVPPNRNTMVDAVDYATTYVYANCPFGESGFNGRRVLEQWFLFNPGALTDDVALRFTFTVTNPLGILLYTQYPLLYGYKTSAPTAAGQYTILGQVNSGGGSFTVPRSALTPSANNWVCLVAGWQSQPAGMVCSGQLVAGLKGPLGDSIDPGGGEFNSGSVALSTITAKLLQVEGSGDIPWVSLQGDVDGTNVTFTLRNWDGTGVPRIRLGGLELGYGSDFTVDDDGVVTLDVAPWAGAVLQGRWRI